LPSDYTTVFNAMPGASALLLPNDPEFTVVGSTDEFASFSGTSKENILGSSLFLYFPDNPDADNVSGAVKASLKACLVSKKQQVLSGQRYDIATADGGFREMYWKIIHTPIINAGNITHIIHTATDVTNEFLSDMKDEKIRSLEPAHHLFMQAAIAIHIFKGPELIIELANEPTLRIWDRDKSIIGKPLREALPELSQHYIDIINKVRLTGESYMALEAPVSLHRDGHDETGYFNFVLQAYYESDSTVPTGVLAIVNEVTQVYNDRKALKEKERSLELAVAIGGLGVFSIDIKKETVEFSPQIMEWLGVTSESLPLSDILQMVHPQDQVGVRNTLAAIIKEGSDRRHDITFRAIHPITGELQYLRSVGQIQTESGQPVALLGIIQNITGNVQSRLELEQGSQRLKSLIDSAPFPIGVYIGKEMRIDMLNQAILDVWHKDVSVIGKNYADVLPELEGQGIFEQLDAVFNTGEAYHAYHSRVDLMVNGIVQSYYFNYSFTPLFDTMGKVYGVMNTAADVTDLVVAQKALKESEQNFRLMILQAPVAMCLLRGPSHIVDIANGSMIALWGKPQKSVLNKPIFEGLPDAKEQGLEDLLAHVYKTGETFSASEHPVVLLRHGKQETVYQNFVYEPYRDANGNILGILAISIDVTDQVLARLKIEEMIKERTGELEMTNASLEKSNAELEQFAYIASHDLQEPLRKINMFMGMLQNSLDESNETARKHMSNISNSVNRMTNLIRDILSYSQLSQTHDPFESANLTDILIDTLADFDLIAEEKGAIITYSNLPAIEVIPLQMVQLFHNLISNALKYSNPDVAPIISITAAKLNGNDCVRLNLPVIAAPYYQIIFRDNGIGFSQEYATKIFNIFQRLHGRGQYEGTGIGLAMCKKIAENHHGIIYANSVAGEGTAFVIVLPAVQ